MSTKTASLIEWAMGVERPSFARRCVYNQAMAKINARWHFRVPAEMDRLVRHAAEAEDKTLTEFVVGAAVVEAERVVGDRTQFILGPEQWACFVDLLDRSPQDNPGLEKLFSGEIGS
jgi:uncharacterized protein (DUF1778 family)